MRYLSLLPAFLCLGFVPAPRLRGHATPQECFEAFVAADRKKDFNAYVACLTEDAIAVRNAYLLYLAAFDIVTKRDKTGEELRVLEKHQVSTENLANVMKSMQKAQEILNRSKKTAKDWQEYNRAAKAISGSLRDQSRFAIDMMTVLFKNRVKDPYGELTITREKKIGRFAELTVEFDSGPNHIVWAIRFVHGEDGWKMMALPLASQVAPPFPPEAD